jgi:hypothetical protein
MNYLDIWKWAARGEAGGLGLRSLERAAFAVTPPDGL